MMMPPLYFQDDGLLFLYLIIFRFRVDIFDIRRILIFSRRAPIRDKKPHLRAGHVMQALTAQQYLNIDTYI